MQEVGLILLRVDGCTKAPRVAVSRDGATRIVPRSNRVTTEERAPLADKCAELDRRIAAHTRARRLTALIRRHKRLQDGIRELLFEVLNVERDAEMIGNATRIIGGVKGATAFAMTVALVGGAVETHPYANDLMSSLYQECRSDR
jgi:hypothetical protein